jgi:prephenate dehydratase
MRGDIRVEQNERKLNLCTHLKQPTKRKFCKYLFDIEVKEKNNFLKHTQKIIKIINRIYEQNFGLIL